MPLHAKVTIAFLIDKFSKAFEPLARAGLPTSEPVVSYREQRALSPRRRRRCSNLSRMAKKGGVRVESPFRLPLLTFQVNQQCPFLPCGCCQWRRCPFSFSPCRLVLTAPQSASDLCSNTRYLEHNSKIVTRTMAMDLLSPDGWVAGEVWLRRVVSIR